MSAVTPTAPRGAPSPASSAEHTAESRLRAILGSWNTLLVFLIIVVFLIGAAISSEFATTASITSGTSGYVEFALLALPLTMIIATGEIDLSVASVLALSSALMGYLWNHNVPIEAIIPICIVVGGFCGMFNGWLITKLGLSSLAVTIGTMALFRGVAFVIIGDQSVTDFPSSYTNWGYGTFAGTLLPNPIVLFIILAIIFAVVLHRTPFGRGIFAIGANPEAARFSGLRVNRTKFQLFVVSGMISALAGVIIALRDSTAAANVGTGAELTAIAAVVLGGVSIFGGTGTIGGVLLALILLAGIQKAIGLDPDIPTYWIQISSGILLIGAVLAPNVLDRAREARQVNQRGWLSRPGRSASSLSGSGPKDKESGNA
jgi:rhamnose transport system permease protein